MTQKNKKLLTPDFCIIGGGAGGLSFAAGAAQLGTSVVLVERGAMGGDCLNAGCVPSKALLAAAKFGRLSRKAAAFGWQAQNIRVDFQKIHDHVHRVIADLAPHDSVERFERLGVHVIKDEASFDSADTIETTNFYIKAKRFIIATGSGPFVPPIAGLEDVPFYTNETIFNLTELPSHLVVIGGGPIGIELAQAFRHLGSDVTVLEAFSVLPKDEPEMVETLKKSLATEGVKIIEKVSIVGIQKNKKTFELKLLHTDQTTSTVRATHILVATGRRPHIQKLNLDKANILYTLKGIVVDDYLRTSNRRVYALGDCVGGYQFTHVAGYHAGIALRNCIFKLRTKAQKRVIPWVTYTDPELAHVGALEADLVAEKIAYKSLTLPFLDNDRSHAEGQTEGMIKVLTTMRGRILGVTILGPHGGELIYPWVIAMQNKLKLTALTSSIAPYPTLSEISKKAAGAFYTDKIFSPLMQKIARLFMAWTR